MKLFFSETVKGTGGKNKRCYVLWTSLDGVAREAERGTRLSTSVRGLDSDCPVSILGTIPGKEDVLTD